MLVSAQGFLIRSVVLFCCLALFSSLFVLGVTNRPQVVLDIADNLRCPTCQGLSVKESNSALSEHMKDEIQKQVLSGKSKDEIFSYFQQRYGAWILRVPPKQGLNWSIWIIPFVVFGLGAGLFVFYVYRKKRA